MWLFFSIGIQYVLTFYSLVRADLDRDGHICDYELHELLKSAGHAMPGYMVRDIIKNLDRNHDNKISFEEFLSVCWSEHRIVVGPVCSEFYVRQAGFILSPASKDLTVLNEQMCVCAFSVCVHGKVENAAKHTRSRNVEVRWLKWFCVPVFGFSCVQGAFIPSFWYRSESLSQNLLHRHHILRYICNHV